MLKKVLVFLSLTHYHTHHFNTQGFRPPRYYPHSTAALNPVAALTWSGATARVLTMWSPVCLCAVFFLHTFVSVMFFYVIDILALLTLEHNRNASLYTQAYL